MTYDLKTMEALLSPIEKQRLQAIFAPTVICTPPGNARRDLCVLADGEIRIYGAPGSHPHANRSRAVYLSSRNCGLDWEKVELSEAVAPIIDTARLHEGRRVMQSCVKTPWSCRWCTLVGIWEGPETGTYAMLSDVGPGDESPRLVKITDEVFGDIFQPLMLERDGKRRILSTGSIMRNGSHCPTVFYSDDNGESWRIVEAPCTPKHTVVYPHRGVRWQNNGAEPNVGLLPDGRLQMLLRTSLDYFWVSYSEDLGETWTDPAPSPFHGTLTTPFQLTLHDGRVITFWNNTRPLAEENHEQTLPPVGDDLINGVWEDYFTNRDANHAAITEDGKNWLGWREMYLNDRRNAADFRVRGAADNSVHQFQAIELPYNKVLVHFGQHEFSRRAAIFDVDWLYETQHSEDFRGGLEHVTTHQFVKSIPGVQSTWPGHCAMNRTQGALLMPDPLYDGTEALHLCRIPDPRLLCDAQGCVWNFPKAYKGRLDVKLYIAGEGVKLRLCDHWMNAADPDVSLWAQFDCTLDARVLPKSEWVTVTVAFDTEKGFAEVFHGEKLLFAVPLRNTAPDGLSYLHLQTAAEGADYAGVYLHGFTFAAN